MTATRRRSFRAFHGAALLAIATLLLLAFGLLVAGGPFVADHAVLSALRDAGPAGWRRAAIDLTALGDGPLLTLWVLAAAVLLLIRRQPLVAGSVILACWSGGRVVQLVKDVVMRARPDVAEHLVPVTSASFPSAHAANSAVVYLMLTAMVAQTTTGRVERCALFGFALLLIGAIGTSRVYLGVHWPSDVLAGWSFGVAWALGWWRLTAHARSLPAHPRQ